MLSYIFTTNSTFQSTLEQFTGGNSETINESLLQNILLTLRGQNEGIKSQFAFASLKKMIGSLQLNKNQQKTLKLLVIFDKLIEDNFYSEQISKIHFLSLQINRITPNNTTHSSIAKILKLYWKIIKEKSILIKDKNHILAQKRSQRTYYFQKLKNNYIINQLEHIEVFFNYIFELIYYIQGPNYSQKTQGMKKNKILEYIQLNLLYKLLALYNCQMITNKYIVKKLKQLEKDSIVKFKKIILKFRQNCNTFINFIKKYANSNIFQIIHFDLIKVEFNEQIIQYIQHYLQALQIQSIQPILTNLPIKLGKIIVQKKIHNNTNLLNSRLKIKNDSKKQIKDEVNIFNNWHNSYSHQFPQKQVLTVELILQIKLQQNMNMNKQRQEYSNQNLYASRCSYDNRSTNVTSNYQINYFSRKQYCFQRKKLINFQNVYSKLQNKWNQA